MGVIWPGRARYGRILGLIHALAFDLIASGGTRASW